MFPLVHLIIFTYARTKMKIDLFAVVRRRNRQQEVASYAVQAFQSPLLVLYLLNEAQNDHPLWLVNRESPCPLTQITSSSISIGSSPMKNNPLPIVNGSICPDVNKDERKTNALMRNHRGHGTFPFGWFLIIQSNPNH